MPDAWAHGAAYERYIGRWSRLVAPRFVDWLGMPAGLRWADVGCGTGALTAAIVERAAPASVLGIEPSEGFAGVAAQALSDEPRVRVHVGDASILPAGSCDVVVSGLVLNFVPDVAAALSSMCAAAPGGTVAAYVWDYAEGMQLIRRFWDAACAVDPSAAPLDEATRFPLCRAEGLPSLWREGGLADVVTTAIEVPTAFSSFADCWEPFLGGQGPAPTYLAMRDAGTRDAIRERFRSLLPIDEDGSVALAARAWAVRGRVMGT